MFGTWTHTSMLLDEPLSTRVPLAVPVVLLCDIDKGNEEAPHIDMKHRNFISHPASSPPSPSLASSDLPSLLYWHRTLRSLSD